MEKMLEVVLESSYHRLHHMRSDAHWDCGRVRHELTCREEAGIPEEQQVHRSKGELAADIVSTSIKQLLG